MPDTTEKLEAARKLVGTYWRFPSGCVGRITGVENSIENVTGICFNIISIRKPQKEDDLTYSTWWGDESGPDGLKQISRAEYLAVAGPLFAELAEMAGITVDCKEASK